MLVAFFEIMILLTVALPIAFSFPPRQLIYKPRERSVVLKVNRAYAFKLALLELFVCLFSLMIYKSSKEDFSECGGFFAVLTLLAFLA